MSFTLFKGLIAAVALSLVAACGSDDHDSSSQTVLATAQSAPDLSSLVAAVQFASNNNDLVDLLAAPGTLTVFAPTNAAFDALARTLTGSSTARAADILVPANKALVRSVLQYHVLTSRVSSSQIPFGKAITPSAGGFFKIDLVGGKPVITDGRNGKSTITTTDINAGNGVVHLVDAVLLPADKTVVQTAIAAAPEFTSLVAALQFASNGNDLVDTLSGAGPFTVFAPTNAAFDALARELSGDPAATAAALLVPANKALLRSVLTYHVVAARVLKADIVANATVASLQGAGFAIATAGSTPVITDARGRTASITGTDVLNSNGVIHVIDRVILPPQ